MGFVVGQVLHADLLQGQHGFGLSDGSDHIRAAGFFLIGQSGPAHIIHCHNRYRSARLLNRDHLVQRVIFFPKRALEPKGAYILWASQNQVSQYDPDLHRGAYRWARWGAN